MNTAPHSRPLLLAALTTAAAVALVACGGGDSGSSALSNAEFVKQTNAICKEHGDAINKVASKFTKAPAGAELTGFVNDTVVPEYSAQIDEIGKLDPPSDISADVGNWLSGSADVRDQLEMDPKAVLTPKTFTDVNFDAITFGLSNDCTPANGD